MHNRLCTYAALHKLCVGCRISLSTLSKFKTDSFSVINNRTELLAKNVNSWDDGMIAFDLKCVHGHSRLILDHHFRTIRKSLETHKKA